ncbi:hypothetical protein EVAR_2660_1 [Eumeta japonica]|uniref:Uncharacterized protein n=1 Tax=Eumeta variegata TaxID=151549 RepID=A0A4C1SPS9_EUMVA|nr:hypothetical protein EVAR_2660_1 [Eumeta japonica]
MLPQQPDSFNGFYTLPDTLKVRYRQSLPGFHAITETDGEGDIDDDEAIDWSNSDEENENIDDNDEN